LALEPVALAPQDDHLGVIDEAVNESGDGHRVAEDLGPGLERLVGADDDRGALVARDNEGKNGAVASEVEGDVGDLIDDDRGQAADPLERL
jgi:hypothetical protein